VLAHGKRLKVISRLRLPDGIYTTPTAAKAGKDIYCEKALGISVAANQVVREAVRGFGYQGGHDAKVWTNGSFQQLMARGIRWTADRKTL
jgi:hypothetical protein